MAAMCVVIPVLEFFVLIWMNSEDLALFTQTRAKRLGIYRTRGSWDVLTLFFPSAFAPITWSFQERWARGGPAGLLPVG